MKKQTKTAKMLRRIESLTPEQCLQYADHCRKSAQAAGKLGETRGEDRLWLKYSVYMKRAHQAYHREGFSRSDARKILAAWSERG